MEKRVLILTGAPGVGKTTALLKIVNALKVQGFSVGGMVSREIREGAVRLGFEVIDIATGNRGWLAHVNQKSGPQVGRYHVNFNDLDTIGAQAINNAVESCSVIVIDEIGPMELFSERFREATQKALASSKLIVAVVHWRASDKLIEETKARCDAESFIVSPESREKLPEIVTTRAIECLKQKLN